MSDAVTIRNPRTGEERRVRPAAVPFFPGFQPVPAPVPEPTGRHEAPESPADPGASTTPTPITLSKEN